MTATALDGGTLWIGDGTAVDGHVIIEGDRIQAVEAGRYRGRLPTEDLAGGRLSPGMIDLMVLGGFNRSILRDDPLDLARAYLRLGVTGCQFCVGTLPWSAYRQIADNIRRAADRDDAKAARILGLYLEGPFQQPDLTGASLREHALPATRENVGRILDELGPAVSMVNVAPGLEGDAAAVRTLSESGKVVSMAHSNGPAERIVPCLEAGTRVIGHIWDNNSGRIGDSGVQQPTLEHLALTDDRIRFIHLICDGTHVHPVMIRLVLRCRGVEALCLVTDAIIRAGCDDGPYENDDGRPFTKQGGVGRTDQGWLCGSALLLPDHLRNLVRFTGLPPEQAIRTVTGNPASSLGLQDRFGFLRPGLAADLVSWSDELRVRRVWRGGREIRDVSDFGEVRL